MFFVVGDPELDGDISFVELKAALKRSKEGKAPGMDNISTEFYKNLPESWLLFVQ